ncbi:hypothetical protein BGX38DRAFT_265034 [Terfezia claveryi]|nr:hypothetical protein BGX38DRAFT_265034 [Terfezia claveryi]
MDPSVISILSILAIFVVLHIVFVIFMAMAFLVVLEYMELPAICSLAGFVVLYIVFVRLMVMAVFFLMGCMDLSHDHYPEYPRETCGPFHLSDARFNTPLMRTPPYSIIPSLVSQHHRSLISPYHKLPVLQCPMCIFLSANKSLCCFISRVRSDFRVGFKLSKPAPP